MKYIKICFNCGEEYTARSSKSNFCEKKECQEMKVHLASMPPLPKPEEDIKIKDIANILQEENITYEKYIKNRKLYINRYYERHNT